MKLDSELLFVGDAEARHASKRHGVEWSNHYGAMKGLLPDADLAMSRARFNVADKADPRLGDPVPGSIQTVVSLGTTATNLGLWLGHFQVRDFGPRALDENNAQRSRATTLAYLRVGCTINPNLRVALDVFKLFNRQGSDINHCYASRLKGEPVAGVNDVHFQPVEPRSFAVTLTANF